MDVLAVDSLTKRYGAVEAERNVAFAVRPNEIVGLLGPNGAGLIARYTAESVA